MEWIGLDNPCNKAKNHSCVTNIIYLVSGQKHSNILYLNVLIGQTILKLFTSIYFFCELLLTELRTYDFPIVFQCGYGSIPHGV